MARARKVQTPGEIASEPVEQVEAVAPEPEVVPVARAREGEPRWQLTEAGWDFV